MNYKTILINLKKDTDRLEFMTKQLNKLEIPFIRLEAVNGKEYMEKDGSEYDDREAIKQLGRSATLGEIGCALSHKRCYQKFLNDPEYQDTKYLLILEDDVELNNNFKKILEEEIQKNEQKYKWNYLQFNQIPVKSLLSAIKEMPLKYKWQYIGFINSVNIIFKIKKIPKLILAPIISTILDIGKYFQERKKGAHPFIIRISFLTGAYLIDKKVAEILLDLTEKVFSASDYVTTKLIKHKSKNMNFYFYSPLIARQKNEKFTSSIDEMEKRV